jgi:hypothetical protein
MSDIFFAVAGIGIAAFCVWLTVRIINRRERWAKRTALALVFALVLYPLSVGPAGWLFVHVLPRTSLPLFEAVYSPITVMVGHSRMVRSLAFPYQDLWVDHDELQEKKFGK